MSETDYETTDMFMELAKQAYDMYPVNNEEVDDDMNVEQMKLDDIMAQLEFEEYMAQVSKFINQLDDDVDDLASIGTIDYTSLNISIETDGEEEKEEEEEDEETEDYGRLTPEELEEALDNFEGYCYDLD